MMIDKNITLMPDFILNFIRVRRPGDFHDGLPPFAATTSALAGIVYDRDSGGTRRTGGSRIA
jgi:hypothetical protein